MKLYQLILTDTELSYENYSEDFTIGIFASREEAERTAKYYLQNVKGFSEYPCTYRIEEKEVIRAEHLPETVWIIQGYDENEDLDEINILESDCFLTKQQALQELDRLQKLYQRENWCINCWNIGESHWKEGFCRV